MKKLLLLLIIPLLFSCKKEKRILVDELIHKGGGLLYYEGSLFNGVAFDVNWDGEKVIEWEIKNGKEHGWHKKWDEFGELKLKEYYQNGVLIEKHVWNTYRDENTENADLILIEKYENGQLIHQKKWENNELTSQKNYKNGNKHGVWIEDSETLFGEKQEGSYKNDKKDGLWKTYYNDIVTLEEYYKDGKQHGSSKLYYNDGQLDWDFNFKDGKRHGICRYFYNNGQIHMEFNYEEGNIIYQKCWDEDGNKISCEDEVRYYC